MLLQTRRRFLTSFTAAGAAGFIGAPRSFGTEPPPEVTRVRLPVYPKIVDCGVPIYVAEEMLRAEGFTDIQFVTKGTNPDAWMWLADGEIDFHWEYAPELARLIAQNVPLKVLAGLHAGCLELIADRGVANVKSLKGKRVGINQLNSAVHVLVYMMAAHVGLDPARDIEWVTGPDPLELLAAGKVDAFLGAAPEPQMARARGIGHVILNSALDRPWSQYYCCMLSGNVDYVKNHPVATRRVLRALLKAVDLCVTDPQRVARLTTDNGLASNYDYALQALAELRFDKWRDFDPEDSMRFYALRLREAGKIGASPQQIIANGTDWRFLNEIRRELKM